MPMRLTAVLWVPVVLAAWLAAAGAPAQAQDVFAGATTAIMNGDHELAIREYETFLADHPDHRLSPVAAMAAGNVYQLVLKDPERALAAFERVLSDYRETAWAPEAARRKGECLQAQEAWEPAGEAYLEAIELAGQPAASPGFGGEGEQTSAAWINEVSLSAADCFYEIGDRERVIGTYEKVLAGALPAEAAGTTLYRLADCYETAGELQQAAERYADLIENYPFANEFGSALAKRELIEPQRKLDWATYDAFARMMQARQQRDFPTIIQAADEVLAGDGSEAARTGAAYNKLLAETIQEGDFTDGIRRLREFEGRNPAAREIPGAQRTMDYLTRVADAEARVRRSPEDADAVRALGRLYLQTQIPHKAIQTLEHAAELDPESPETQLNLGYAYASGGRNADATAAFERYLEDRPDDTGALNIIGYTYLNQGEPDKAIVYFERYAKLAPDDANAHDSLGEGYLRAGRLEDAAREYETAIELDNSFSNSYFMVAGIYRQLEQPDMAAAAYRRLIELTPGGVQAEQARAALAELEAE